MLGAATAAIAVVAGCSALGKQAFQQPVVHLQDVRVNGIGLPGGNLAGKLRADNPNGSRKEAARFCAHGTTGRDPPPVPSRRPSALHRWPTSRDGNWHRPSVFSPPRSIPRNKLAMSMPTDITGSTWQPAVDDPKISDPAAVTRLVLCSGKIRWQTLEFIEHTLSLRLRLIDRFDFLSYRPQPLGRRQVHARRNSSTLLVFQR